jgi:hypothetical protein
MSDLGGGIVPTRNVVVASLQPHIPLDSRLVVRCRQEGDSLRMPPVAAAPSGVTGSLGDDNGLPSGVFILRLRANGRTVARCLLVG